MDLSVLNIVVALLSASPPNIIPRAREIESIASQSISAEKRRASLNPLRQRIKDLEWDFGGRLGVKFGCEMKSG